MAQTKPVYVFVGGISHTPAFFEDLIKQMIAHGYESTVATYGDNTENVKQRDEVTAIQDVVSSFLDVKGLDKEARRRMANLQTLLRSSSSPLSCCPTTPPWRYSYLPPWLTVENGRRIPNKSSILLLFSDMEAAAQKHWFSKFEWQRNDFTAETASDAPWHLSIPKTYIITTDDKTATVEFQFQMLQRVIDKTCSVKSIKTGHEPFLSQPANLAKVFLQPTV